MKYLLAPLVWTISLPAFSANEMVEARVKRIIVDGTSEHVVISAGSEVGLVPGQIMVVSRGAVESSNNEKVTVRTGKVKLIKVDATESIGKAIEDGTHLSKIYFAKFPMMMTNDTAEVEKVEIVNKTKITPSISLSYFDCFIDPKAYPSTYELTDAGHQRIREVADQFAEAKVSVLLIEGHTDANGPSSTNQVESYQRALAIRQYLVDDLGFDAERVVAVGLGESEMPDNTKVPGYERVHRRISFKLLNPSEIH